MWDSPPTLHTQQESISPPGMLKLPDVIWDGMIPEQGKTRIIGYAFVSELGRISKQKDPPQKNVYI